MRVREWNDVLRCFKNTFIFLTLLKLFGKYFDNYRAVVDDIRSLRQQIIDLLLTLANCHYDFLRYFMLTKILLYLGRVLVVQITRVFSPSTSARVLPFFLPFHSVSWAGCPKINECSEFKDWFKTNTVTYYRYNSNGWYEKTFSRK